MRTVRVLSQKDQTGYQRGKLHFVEMFNNEVDSKSSGKNSKFPLGLDSITYKKNNDFCVGDTFLL